MDSVQDEERDRLAALSEYGIDAALAEPGFERLVQLAGNVFKVPILTYLPIYGGVGLSRTDGRTTPTTSRKEEGTNRTSIEVTGSTPTGNRYSGWPLLKPLPSRSIAVEVAGESVVAISEHFAQALIDHGQKGARYFTDAYRPQWLESCGSLHDCLHDAVLSDIRSVGIEQGTTRDQLQERVESEVLARCDLVFEYVASYQGDDQRFQHIIEPGDISCERFIEAHELSELGGTSEELRAPAAAEEAAARAQAREEQHARLMKMIEDAPAPPKPRPSKPSATQLGPSTDTTADHPAQSKRDPRSTLERLRRESHQRHVEQQHAR